MERLLIFFLTYRMSVMINNQPLNGKSIDLTNIIMGPFATQLLGDLGADIIKLRVPRAIL